jgi:hypothetical protein
VLVYIRRLLGLTDQADPTCFYFRIGYRPIHLYMTFVENSSLKNQV